MDMIIKLVNALLAVIAGVGGALILYWFLNKVVERLPNRTEDKVKPFVFIGPAVLLVSLFLLYPAIRTILLSLANAQSTAFVGLANYSKLLGNGEFRGVLFNTLLWMIIVPTAAVAVGLLIAVLSDRMNPRGEKLAKTLIFMPMAISLVGASAIWSVIYQAAPKGSEQPGLLNAIVTAFGGDPQAWLQFNTARINSLLLMVILIWLQTGFAMVLLSAAIKSVPEDTIEAGRIDGASEVAIFFRIVVPQIWPTVITVFVTVLLGTMKVFDIVNVMTNGSFNTDVIANRFYTELFTNGNAGNAAAIVVILMIAIIPFMVYQVRQFRKQEAER
ncbi:carbohydrate ABC transporter permease [Lapillicoccus sp.]|uniref:carbohydrate ABC transporter permease n=1 Tax=Lapillicoccus sp. TaxID=1909287 RepID=UPI003983C739